MKKKVLIYSFILIIVSSLVVAEYYNNPLTISIGDRRYCKLLGNCELNSLIVQNLSVTGDFFNVSVVNYNVTGDLTISGNVVAVNGTFEEIESGNITINTGVNTNPTLKYREGTIENGFDMTMRLFSTNYLYFNAIDSGVPTTRFRIRRLSPEIDSFANMDFQNDYNITNLDCLELGNEFKCSWDEVTAGSWDYLNYTNSARGDNANLSLLNVSGLTSLRGILDMNANKIINQIFTLDSEAGLLSYYPFENGTGKDFMGTNDMTTISGAVPTDDGRVGKAFTFDGADDYLTSTGVSNIHADAEFTMSAWFRTKNIASAQIIVFTGNTGIALQTAALALNIVTGDGAISVEFNAHGARSAAGVYSANKWHHFAATKTPGAIDTTTKLYLDGEEVQVDSASASTPNIANSAIVIGEFGAAGSNFEGEIDEVKVYNRSLSGEEIRKQYLEDTKSFDKKFATLSINSSTIDGYRGDTLPVDDLTSYYPLDDNGRDFIRTNDANLVPNEDLIEGYLGNSITNNGQGTQLSNITFLNSDKGSITLWVKSNKTTGDDNQGLFGAYDGTNEFAALIVGEDIYFRYGNAQNQIIWAEYIFEGSWNHFTFTWDESGEQSIYYNSVLKQTGATGWSAALDGFPLHLMGIDPDSSSDFAWYGWVDELTIWNKSLTGEEIRRVYQTSAQFRNEHYTISREGGSYDISENLNLDGGTFFVDSENNKVGIGITRPNEKLTVVGNFNLTGNMTGGGYLNLGNDTRNISSIFNKQGDAFFDGRIVADGSVTGWASPYGIGLMALENDGDYDFISTGETATLDADTQFICDSIDPWTIDHIDMFLSVIDSTPSYIDATGEITDFINSTCIRVSFASAGGDTIVDAIDMSYYVYPHPVFAALDNGFISTQIGVNPDAKFEIHIPNGTGFHGVYIEDTAGADQHQSITIDTNLRNFDGIVGLNSFVYSSIGAANIRAANQGLELDFTGVNNSHFDFLDLIVISKGINGNNNIDALHISPMVDHIIEMGSEDEILSAWYYNGSDNINITDQLKNDTNDITLFENDNDFVYIGSDTNFTTVSFSLEQASSHNLGTEHYYCNSTEGWELLEGITGTTNGLKISGSVSFTNPSNRGICNVSVDGDSLGSDKYAFIGFKRTTNNIVTPPTENLVSISGGTESFILQKDGIQWSCISSPPWSCTINGGQYCDSDLTVPCWCDGTNWVQMDDYSTVCS